MRRRPSRAELGRTGENLAVDALRRATGARVLERNVVTRFGEIDLLARKGRLWIAVEVKTRRDHPAPERAVTATQLARVRRALRALAPTLRPAPAALRVDIVAIRTGSDAPSTWSARHFPGTPFAPS